MDNERISIYSNSITINGVSNVVSIFDKEAVINTEGGLIEVVGQGLTASKLELDKGLLVLSFESLVNIRLGREKRKLSLSNLFK
ncbi:MAG: YabP/YqfC family sporulation protein [Clostridia bacterium]|nr:YabP/YqfC family sporulation protein [Clostridia bacterium]